MVLNVFKSRSRLSFTPATLLQTRYYEPSNQLASGRHIVHLICSLGPPEGRVGTFRHENGYKWEYFACPVHRAAESEVEVTVTYNSDGTYSMEIGGEMFQVSGEVETEGQTSFLHCSVNGVKSRPKLVILDNTVHLFSMHTIRAPKAGVIKKVFFKEGSQANRHAALVEFEEAAEEE